MAEAKKIGRYEIRRKLGEGGMGEVFLAHDSELDREVAIKVLLPEFCCNLERVNRFKLEAKAASALNHPNIITIYEIGGDKDSLYIVTENIKGETLRSLIQKGAVTGEDALSYAQQIADALNSAHKEGIVHRDIKPENIMVREDGIVKVLDFGLAKPTQIESEAKTLELVKTKAGMVMGSVGYMSPEQARGKEVDQRTDLWSLGVVLYEMLTGNTPFDGETMTDILANIIHKDPTPITEFLDESPVELHRIVKKSLRKNPDERYQTAKDFSIDLKNLSREVEIGTSDGTISGQFKPVGTATKSIRLQNTQEAKTLLHQSVSADSIIKTNSNSINFSRKRTWLIPIGIVGLAIMLAVGAWLFRPRTSSQRSFDSLEISKIANSDKAFAPSISPDGKYLGYVNYENGKKSLVVRQIATGSVIPLVSQIENEGFLQPAFSPDGNYVYYVLADKGVGTLYQIPTLGGSPKKLVNDIDSKVAFSADGKQIAFTRRDAETGFESIYIANADGTNEKLFISSKDLEVKGFNEVAWTPNGDNLLVSAVSDYLLDELTKTKILLISTATKEARKFSNREWLNAGSFFWTKDKSLLLMLAKSNDQEPSQIWQVSFPDGERARRITNDSSGYQLISFAKDADVITAAKQNTISSLWSFNPVNKELNQITTDNKDLLGAAGFEFMPDGRFLVSSLETNKGSLISLSADGKDEKSLTSDENFNGHAVVSPDGKSIVFTVGKSNNFSIWRMNIDGQNPIQLTNPENAYDSRPQITSDSKTVIFERRLLDFTKSTLMKVSIDGGEATTFVNDDKPLQIFPRISDDGKLFVYSTMNFDKANTRYNRSVRILAMNGSEITGVKKELDTGFGYSYRISPDGKNITYINQSGVPNIYNFPLDGSAPKQITNFNSGHILNFVWSKDGKKLYIVRAIINSELVLLKNTR
ncbi:MAG: serine/threonine-protein kinase [Pyrinomonadaceae bacterium]|nr:serine/threonine-protein kinase [Pyrinomonadaceae bacterium]